MDALAQAEEEALPQPEGLREARALALGGAEPVVHPEPLGEPDALDKADAEAQGEALPVSVD